MDILMREGRTQTYGKPIVSRHGRMDVTLRTCIDGERGEQETWQHTRTTLERCWIYGWNDDFFTLGVGLDVGDLGSVGAQVSPLFFASRFLLAIASIE